jgi:hypothetical protein
VSAKSLSSTPICITRGSRVSNSASSPRSSRRMPTNRTEASDQSIAPARCGAIPGVRLISLQKGAGVEDIPAAGFQIETLGERFDEGGGAFLDSAAVMMNLDLVVTPCNAIAHLAGALGRPTFVALMHVPEWRWLLNRDNSPWYPATRLFRQSSAGDWPGVFARIADAVRARASRAN